MTAGGRNRLNLIGQRFGRLVVTKYAGIRRKQSTWHCRCDCGGRTVADGPDMNRGDIQSCGCLVKETAVLVSKTYKFIHGETNQNITAEYRVWRAMRQRCYNPNCKAFRNYGGRGIAICERWLQSYPTFLADMGRRPSPQHSLDRINNDGNYTPENCRWATKDQQAKNQRRARK